MDQKLKQLLLVSTAIRLLLVAWSEYQDKRFEVAYTDIDYIVFTEAACLVVNGQSPFLRATYRYSPLLAYILTPNCVLHTAFGKILFSLLDIATAYIIASLVTRNGFTNKHAVASAAVWLLNPFTATISTRGSCDVIVITMMLTTLWLLVESKISAAGLLYGLAVHFRIYPIIYAPSIVLALLAKSHQSLVRSLQKAAIFTASSSICFVAWGCLFYHLYGMQFLNETYLYHFSRRDPRHNFSIYFYDTYLRHYGGQYTADSAFNGPLPDPGRLAFISQAGCILVLSLRTFRQLPLSWTLTTMAFVAFNKVSTAQYFVWYFGLLPLLLPNVPWPPPRALKLAGSCWVAAQLHWLLWAYLLEFQGLPVYLGVWAAGLLFLAANVALLLAVLKHARQRPGVHEKLKEM